ncbi:MAG: nucleoside hydrolase [Acidobacteriota bacterium]
MVTESRPASRLWVDTDIALGAARGDVDDGLALAAIACAHLAGDVELLGVSATFGNTDAATAERCARDLLDAAGLAETQVVGAREAPAALASLEEGAQIVALGPLANVAAALDVDSELPARTSLSVVATVLGRNPLLASYCLNFRKDPEAARRAMRAGFSPRRVFPLDTVRRLRVGRSQLEELAAVGPLGERLAVGSRRWLRSAPWRYLSFSFPAWDLVAALAAVDRLPDARFDEEQRLVDFDVERAWQEFVALVGARGREA